MWKETADGLMSNGLMLADYGRETMQWSGHGHGPFAILIAIAVIVVLAFVVRWIWRGGKACSHGARKNALDTLAQRFAKGEIDKDEYLEKRDVLKSRH
ncbi:MAG: SHOCT domain-containing protein [Alphaproteobacteria bacterium]